MLRQTLKAHSIALMRANLKREVLEALCPSKRSDPSFSNEPTLEATSKKKGSLPARQGLSASVLDCLTKGARAAKAKPCLPLQRRPPPPREWASSFREATRRALSPWEPTPSPTVNKGACVLVKTGTTQQIQDIRGPTRTLQELTKQLNIIATALTAARASPVPPPNAFLPKRSRRL